MEDLSNQIRNQLFDRFNQMKILNQIIVRLLIERNFNQKLIVCLIELAGNRLNQTKLLDQLVDRVPLKMLHHFY